MFEEVFIPIFITTILVGVPVIGLILHTIAEKRKNNKLN